MNSTLGAALEYRQRREWSVMATPERSKKRARRWRHLQRRLPTAEEVRQDFGCEPGIPNVAIVCGQVSGDLVVLDVDGPEAEVRVRELALPSTLTAKTARARHLYWRSKGKVATRRIGLSNGSGLELRAEGSYVLAPPSIHPSGFRYEFEDPDARVAELPEAVLALFAGVTEGQPLPGQPEVPERWLRLIEGNSRTRAAWEGRGEHQDRSGSGKDLFLAHEARRCGFDPEEARRIVLAAPWSVEGGRTASYLDRTLARAYRAGQKRQLPAYGQIPAALVDDGTFAGLSWPEKGLVTVLCARRMRPSNTVLRNQNLLARDLGVGPDWIGRVAARLEERGLITRERVAGGRLVYNLLFFSPGLPGGVREAHEEAATEEAKASPGVTRTPRPGKKKAPTRSPRGGKTVLVHESEEERSGGGVPPESEPGRGPGQGGSRCHTCGGSEFWRSVAGVVLCAACHPPADPSLVSAWMPVEEDVK